MDIPAKNVSEIVSDIKDLLESHFANVAIIGEITNLSLSSSGHWYFNLSDKDASMSAALFKMDALRNPLIRKIKDGDKVIAIGDINVYPKRGTFQIIVKKLTPIGVGDLKEQFEKLKRKLSSEGLFDLDTKKPIPSMPKRVAIITAPRSAALADFINIYKRRSIWMDLVVVPSLVQGEDAPKAIRQALFSIIKYSLNAPTEKKIDLIVLARGGGSLEDLWAFNDEALAWDLHNCPIPTISAVGHEIDYSISDFVCDLRAETPSAAAEIITNHQTMIREKMNSVRSRLSNAMELKSHKLQFRLKRAHPKTIINLIWERFNNFQKRLNRCDLRNRLHDLTRVHEFYVELDIVLEEMKRLMKERLVHLGHKLERSDGLLKALNPSNVLQRGYSFVESDESHVVSSVESFDDLPSGAELNLHFYNGKRKVFKK